MEKKITTMNVFEFFKCNPQKINDAIIHLAARMLDKRPTIETWGLSILCEYDLLGLGGNTPLTVNQLMTWTLQDSKKRRDILERWYATFKEQTTHDKQPELDQVFQTLCRDEFATKAVFAWLRTQQLSYVPSVSNSNYNDAVAIMYWAFVDEDHRDALLSWYRQTSQQKSQQDG